MPTGLVKLMIQARGASLRDQPRVLDRVRDRAHAPSRSRRDRRFPDRRCRARSAIASSRARAAIPPTRMLRNTKLAPRTQAADVGVGAHGAGVGPRQRADDRQARLIDVEQRDLVDRQDPECVEPVDEQRRAHAAAADDGNLHRRFRAGCRRPEARRVPPARRVDSAPTRFPSAQRARRGPRRAACAARKPALNASPAPVVSTTPDARRRAHAR